MIFIINFRKPKLTYPYKIRKFISRLIKKVFPDNRYRKHCLHPRDQLKDVTKCKKYEVKQVVVHSVKKELELADNSSSVAGKIFRTILDSVPISAI